ncbi:MAG: aspartate-semialdehyde dehydrogenase [Chlorobi bacterium]|nr:aspartate-semialdehyde dehydrogenase [Chlorobiota bacterium]
MKAAIVGVTGLVGSVLLKVLEERKLPITEFIPAASEKSEGKYVILNNLKYKIKSVEDAINAKPDIVIFSAGSEVSLKYAPIFSEKGAFVIDNSSAWRLDTDKKLIIPEINGNLLTKEDKIISNPNCSVIQMLMVLYPLHKKYRIKRVVVSTYQSVTGTGQKAVDQLINERANIHGEKAYPHRIDNNCLPHCDVFTKNGYTKEEDKLVSETHKILSRDINVTATAVRVPVLGGHSEAVNIEFENDYTLSEINKLLKEMPGVVVYDNPENNTYPMPIITEGKDEVFVGRIRRDYSQANSLNLWIVADNLRKGAATNAVQIAELLIEKSFVKK